MKVDGEESVARVPLMSRHICRSIGRRTLINKGYSKEIAIIYILRAWAAIACRSVAIFHRTSSFAVRMHAHVLVSRDSSIFEVYVVPSVPAFEESIDRGCSPRPLRVLPPSLSFPIGHRDSDSARRETQNFDSIKYLNETRSNEGWN